MTVHGDGEALLEPRLVGKLGGRFWVPSYQRGYRWGAEEVRLLLDDLWTSEGKPYYLQPIVVRPLEGAWELVDGQQRLTTLFLLLQYMRNEGLQSLGAAYTLEYETRPHSAGYLAEPHEDRAAENIDFFHIYEAYRCIAAWFDSCGIEKQFVANELYGMLFKSVRVIWYEAPPDLDATALFTRLNVGRIPLTNAELVKAHLLSRSGARAEESAAQWDAIERDLRQPDLWAFASGDDRSWPTHISLLLDTLAERDGVAAHSKFHTFERLKERVERDGPDVAWHDVVDLHALLVGWFEDPDVYHMVGYLIATGTSLGELERSARDQTRSSFRHELAQRIKRRVVLSAQGVSELAYDSDSAKIEQVLLLANVESVRRRGTWDRFAFREHAARTWSLEHVHAQNAEALNKAEQWTEWLTLHEAALAELPGVDDETRTSLLRRIRATLADVTEHGFRALEEDITAVFSTADAQGQDVHGIANLALLSSADNSALSNAMFEVKRQRVLERDKAGGYLPPVTRNLFLKYYTATDAQQVHFWGAQDRQAHLDALLDLLDPYLLESDVAS